MAEKLLVKNQVCFVPVLHGHLEFALAVRRAWTAFRPEAVAVELPRPLSRPVLQAVGRLPHLSVVLFELGEETSYLLIEPTDPAVEALRLAAGEGLPAHLIDAQTPRPPQTAEAWPDSYALARLGLADFTGSFLSNPPPATETDGLRERTMAHRLQELAVGKRVLFVCGLAHAGRIWRLLDQPQPLPLAGSPGGRARLAGLDPESIKEVTSEIPYLIKAFEDWRADPVQASGDKTAEPDRLMVFEELLKEAAQTFKRETGEEITPWQFRVLRRFRRNWSLLSGRLSPDFYQLVMAAKGVGGDEYAHCVWRKAIEYPWSEVEPGLESFRLTAEDLGLRQRKVGFFKPLRRTRPRLVPLPRRPLVREGRPGQWAEVWAAGTGLCSYPPEDIVIEDFGRQAAAKALNKLAEANRVVEPFTVSLKDGIDLRETLRRVAEERIYVYEERSFRSQVGAVVVVFDPDEGDEERFPWRLTWLGEHQDESDMAFYATPPGEDLVGPGLSRCIYGGLVMTYPPQRMFDIWEDAYFDPARTKAERLLLAGADYSRERVVAYLARRPPDNRTRSLVQRMGRQVAYLPLGLFGPAFIQKIRVFHVLAGHDVRGWAGDYLGGSKGFKRGRTRD